MNSASAVRMTDAEKIAAVFDWRNAEAEAAEAKGAAMFMGLPDAWFEDPHWFCANGHVSARHLSGDGGVWCLGCREPVVLGPLIDEAAFAPILAAIIQGETA